MATMTADAAPTGARATRQRILDAAGELFYAQGIRGTSADRILEHVGVSKVTFYRHFRTKDDLVVAYLEGWAAQERAMFEGARAAASTPADALSAIASGIGAVSCQPGFRGCAFINAAAEYPDASHPVRRVVDEHRAWMVGLFSAIAADAGVQDAATAGRRLMMLRDGAMIAGYLGEPQTIAETLAASSVAVLTGA